MDSGIPEAAAAGTPSAPCSWAAAQERPPPAQFARLRWTPRRPGTPISVRAASRGRAPPGAGHTPKPALTAQVVGPLVQHALHGARGPLTAPARRGDTGPASHPGPGGGVTATAREHQLRVGGLRLRLARSVWTRRSRRRREAKEARPRRRRSPAPYRGHGAHSVRPGALAHAQCAARTLPNPRRGLAAAPWGRRAGLGCGGG